MGKGRDFTQDPKIQGKLRAIDKAWSGQKKLDLERVMRTPEGRRFVYDLIFDRCELMGHYSGQDSGIYRHAGKRDVGFKLAQDIQTDHPDLYVSMLIEHVRDDGERQKLRQAALTPSAQEEGEDPDA